MPTGVFLVVYMSEGAGGIQGKDMHHKALRGLIRPSLRAFKALLEGLISPLGAL